MFEQYIKVKGEEIKEELINIRREIHKYPELGLQEINTAHKVEGKLLELGLKVHTGIAKTGVVGILEGKYPGKTIMLRGDMDCLEIQEQTDVPYKSNIDGLMHACGHDAHTAWLMGAAMILSGLKDEIHGNVKFVFQPGEENRGGANLMIKDGVLENPHVDAVIGGHVWPYIESGKIGVKTGALMAAVDNFKLTIIGKGGHGGQPHKCIDPIASGCEIYMAFQTIISRNMNPLEPAVITVGKFQSGTAHNVIPGKVEMEGTIRTISIESRKEMQQAIERVIKGITEANGTKYELQYIPYHPPVINNKKMTEFLYNTSVELFGENNVNMVDKPTMAGEDFSYFQEKVPGVFFWMGSGNLVKGTDKALHNSSFNLDEDIIHKAAMLLSQCAINYLSQQ